MQPFADYGDALAAYFTATTPAERQHADRECTRLKALDADCKDAVYWWQKGTARAVPAMAKAA